MIKHAQEKLHNPPVEREYSHNYPRIVCTVFERISDGYLTLDPDYMITYWNRQAELITGLKRENVLGKSLWIVFPELVDSKFKTEYSRALSENIPVYFRDYFSPLKIWLEVSAYPENGGLSVYFRDDTEKTNAVMQLRAEERKYQELFEASPLPQWVFGLETLKFLDVNQAAVAHYGYSKKEFLQMSIMDIRPTEAHERLRIILDEEIEEGVFNENLVIHRKKNGEIISVKVETNSVIFKGRNARFVQAIDVTEQLKSKKALEESELRFKSLIQEGSDLIAIVTHEGIFDYVNTSTKSILGIDEHWLIGKLVFDFIHTADREQVKKEFKRISVSKRVIMTPYRFKIRDDEYRWIETILTRADDDSIDGVISNSRDITQRIENETKTLESISRFNIVSKATSDAIWDWDISTGVIICNKGMKGIFGYERSDYDNNWFNAQVHPDDLERLIEEMKEAILNRTSKAASEYRFRCADGTYKYVLDRSFLLFDNNGEPARMIGSMQDITERVNYIRDIEQQNTRLREISWMQSHHVRAPLARILGISTLIADHLKNGPESDELLDYLLKSVHELDLVVRDIVKKTEDSIRPTLS